MTAPEHARVISGARAVVAPRLKWHMLRRRKSDACFLRENLLAALQAGAACEVDLQFTADGHAFCLHDRTLDRETTGEGPANAATREQVAGLRQRNAVGGALGSAPLFLDEVVAMVRAQNVTTSALVQLDVKTRASALSAPPLERFGETLGNSAQCFIASAYEWATIEHLVAAAPGLHAGFDPLAFYPRSFALRADEFHALGARTLVTAPGAAIYYLEWRLVLAALDVGVNLIAAVQQHGAAVDVWTIDADTPNVRDVLQRVIAAGGNQITSNEPELLQQMIAEIVREVADQVAGEIAEEISAPHTSR